MEYTNNEEILVFLNKAQHKIADYSTYIVKVGEDDEILYKLIELSDFIESIDSIFCYYSEKDILRWIHMMNQRHNLNAIPFLQIVGYQTNIISGGSSLILPISVYDLLDYKVETIKLIQGTEHNSLSGLQGGDSTHRYHLTQVEYQFLQQLMNPFVKPVVSLTLRPSTIEWYERGIPVKGLTLIGDYNTITNPASGSRYKIISPNSKTLMEVTGNNKREYKVTESITQDTIFRFEVDFTDDSKGSDDKSVRFTYPIWSGLYKKGTNATTVQQGTKIVKEPSNSETFNFNIPTTNTSTSYPVVPYILVSKAKGDIKSFIVESIFDTKLDWILNEVLITLSDNSQVAYYLCEFKNVVAGSYTFTVNWN